MVKLTLTSAYYLIKFNVATSKTTSIQRACELAESVWVIHLDKLHASHVNLPKTWCQSTGFLATSIFIYVFVNRFFQEKCLQKLLKITVFSSFLLNCPEVHKFVELMFYFTVVRRHLKQMTNALRKLPTTVF